MTNIPYSELKKGSFLVASPEIDDGIFFRSVVLLCDHSPVGSFGLIVNKPLEIEAPEEILDLEVLQSAHIPNSRRWAQSTQSNHAPPYH